MKLLIVHNLYKSDTIGGEDLVFQRELTWLKERLGDDKVLSYSVSNDHLNKMKLLYTLWGDRTHYQNIYNLVKKEKIDIVHVHNFFPMLSPSVMLAAKKAGAVVVQTLHNFRWWCLSGLFYLEKQGFCQKCLSYQMAWPGVKNRCYRKSLLQSFLAGLAFWWYKRKRVKEAIDYYFVLSKTQVDLLKNGLIPPQKLILKSNAILETAPPTPKAKKGYLYVGRLEEAKGIKLLLKVWEKLDKEYQLTIIGSGPLEKSLTMQYQKDNIHFLGNCPSDGVIQHMQKAKFLIHPGMAVETFGLTILEAMSHGTPVIGLNIGTRSEWIQDGQNGYLCSPHDLGETIQKSAHCDNYEQMVAHAYHCAKPYFLNEVMNKQLTIYEKILNHA